MKAHGVHRALRPGLEGARFTNPSVPPARLPPVAPPSNWATAALSLLLPPNHTPLRGCCLLKTNLPSSPRLGICLGNPCWFNLRCRSTTQSVVTRIRSDDFPPTALRTAGAPRVPTGSQGKMASASSARLLHLGCFQH